MEGGAGEVVLQLAVITDEISDDLEQAILVMQAHSVQGAELRGLWGKNISELDPDTRHRTARLLKMNDMRICSIASPVYKTDLFEAEAGPAGAMHYAETVPLHEQIRLLQQCLETANFFECPLLRIFAFWRRAQWTPEVQDKIVAALEETLPYAEKAGVTIGLENEHACMVGTGLETRTILDRIPSPYLKVIYDPGNAFALGEEVQAGYPAVRDRMVHLHIKDGVREGDSVKWVVVGEGEIDYLTLFELLKRDGYTGYVSLETHAKVPGMSQAEVSARCLPALRKLINENR
jgi:sugar phosphate isomerase/epimerase